MSTQPIILVVDDHDDGRDVLCLQLRLSGYRAMAADSVAAAMALARTVRFDLYILDHYLKDGTGKELRECLLELDPKIPAVIHSARPFDHEEIRALRENGDEFLIKPAEMPAIQSAVAQALRSAHERRTLFPGEA